MFDDILKELPMGFGMALAQNIPALERFSGMTGEQQAQIVAGTHSVNSKSEMRAYVERLTGAGT